MGSLMPLQRSVTPWKVSGRRSVWRPAGVRRLTPACVQAPPLIRPFSEEEFVSTLEQAGPQLTSLLRGDWMGLYR